MIERRIIAALEAGSPFAVSAEMLFRIVADSDLPEITPSAVECALIALERAGRVCREGEAGWLLSGALHADARRYRWLRDYAHFHGRDDGQPSPWVVSGTDFRDARPFFGNDLDDLIDGNMFVDENVHTGETGMGGAP